LLLRMNVNIEYELHEIVESVDANLIKVSFTNAKKCSLLLIILDFLTIITTTTP
jgi:hypothetical protein